MPSAEEIVRVEEEARRATFAWLAAADVVEALEKKLAKLKREEAKLERAQGRAERRLHALFGGGDGYVRYCASKPTSSLDP
jgi:hypothetical protein